MDIKNIIIITALVVLVIAWTHSKKKIIAPLIIAFLISLAWTTYFQYEYTGNNVFLFNRINIYPLILWTVGLTIVWLAHTKINIRYGLMLTTILYLLFLAAGELIGYHIFNVRLASGYTSLLGLGVIHAPLTMKLFYIVAGPVHILISQGYNRYVSQQ